MLDSKSKYAWEGWESTGNEDWVFAVKHPCELIGAHAKLIDALLSDSEKVGYCIYAPRVPSTSTPFGLEAAESSSGVCVTDKRFIISNDKHISGMDPALSSINFEDVLSFNIGSAMLLSWFSLRFMSRGEPEQITILFSSNGKHHFQKALRVFKKYARAGHIAVAPPDGSAPARHISKIDDTIHRDYLKTLLSAGEKRILAFSCRYVEGKIPQKRSLLVWKKQAAYRTGKATVLLTNKALMFARDSAESSAGISIDVLNVSLDKVKNITVREEPAGSGKTHTLTVSFDGEAENLEIGIAGIDGQTKVLLDGIPSLVTRDEKNKKLCPGTGKDGKE